MQFLTPLSVAKTIKEHRAYTSSRSASPSDARLDRISLVLHLQQHKMRRLRQLLELARQASGLHSLQQSGPRSSRAFSERPGRLEEYSNYYKKSDTISTRAQAEEAAEPAPAEPSTSAAEPSSTATEQPSNMQREGAQSGKANCEWCHCSTSRLATGPPALAQCSYCLDVSMGETANGWQRALAHLGTHILGRLRDCFGAVPLLPAGK